MTTPLFERRIRPIVVEALRDAHVVLVSGARQVGGADVERIERDDQVTGKACESNCSSIPPGPTARF